MRLRETKRFAERARTVIRRQAQALCCQVMHSPLRNSAVLLILCLGDRRQQVSAQALLNTGGSFTAGAIERNGEGHRERPETEPESEDNPDERRQLGGHIDQR